MNFFTCILDPNGGDPPYTARRAYESLPRSRGLAFEWQCVGQVLVLSGGDTPQREPLVASFEGHLAVGMVRLDNRTELARWSECHRRSMSDLELVLRTVVLHGVKYIPRFLGDFAFIVWSAPSRTVVAAIDPFAVRKLYYTERDGLLAFSSRAEMLTRDSRFDVQYLAERVAACVPTSGLSVYASVKSIPGSTMALMANRKVTLRRYWSPFDIAIDNKWIGSENEAAELCRDLLSESVRLRLSADDDNWAQLSGGLDSSSVVSVAQWLVARGVVPHGLAGTATFVDTHGTGADEREYSDAVAQRWKIRNTTIIDPPLWFDEAYSPPHTDEPSALLPVYPRDCRFCEIIRRAGGRVLLTGVGGDDLFAGNMLFFADWLAQGRIWPAVREMVSRAAIGRVSFWELAYLNALLPLLPQRVQQRLVRDPGRMPSWLASATIERYGLDTRAVASSSYSGRFRHKFADAIATGVSAIASGLSLGLIEDSLDVRHPFLYRPLVEFALRLPPELRVRPHARKWVLREAMRGILPETVRSRIGKGVILGLVAWSTANQQKMLEPLIRESILVDLGIVDGAKLRASFAAARYERANRERFSGAVQYTLAVEAWLQMRSGRWPRGTQSATQY